MSARGALRSATAADHARVDALFSAHDLSNARGYGDFLVAQARAHLPVEAALDAYGVEALLPDWPERRRAGALIADLGELSRALPEPLPLPPFVDDDAAALGIVYVLEGSRLGGSLLNRSIADHLPRRFVGSPARPGSWRNLLTLLDRALADPERLKRAEAAARATFARFADAAESAG